MLSTSVIIMLREVLEAVFLVSLFLSVSRTHGISNRWLVIAVPLGSMAAIAYAASLPLIAGLFDGVGQEISNALSQFTIAILLPLCLLGHIRALNQTSDNNTLLKLGMTTVTALALMREGGEIYLYLSAFLGVPEWRSSLYAGSSIGIGLGLSIGALFYFWLCSFSARRTLLISSILASMIAAGMSLQGCKMLIQADWMNDGQLWDSSGLLSEDSATGQLFYALFGYEASPSANQVACYFTVLLLSLAVLLSTMFKTSNAIKTRATQPTP